MFKIKEWLTNIWEKVCNIETLLKSVRGDRRPVVYLAGYISTGSNDKGEDILTLCEEWRNWFKEKCPEARFIDPLDGEAVDSLRKRGLISDLPPRAILMKDLLSVTKSDIVVANLDIFGGSRPLIGTIVELGWAYLLNKPILLLASTANYTQHPFMTGMAACLDHRKTEVLRVLKCILTGS